MFSKINLFLTIFSFFLLSCGDKNYCYRVTQDNTKKIFCFKEKFQIKSGDLDSLVNLSILNCYSKIKNGSTFEVLDLKINTKSIRDTSILTINGFKQIKNPVSLEIMVRYSGKNLYGVASNFNDSYTYLLEDKKPLIEQPIQVKLKIEEVFNEKPSYVFEHKHTVDSLFIIFWDNTNLTVINNLAEYRGNIKSNLSISKNNMLKAVDILNNKSGQYKMDRDILSDDSFGLSCGIYDPLGKYNYNDEYCRIEANNKEELLLKLNFVLKFIYGREHKPSEWKVTKKDGKNQEVYMK